MIYYNDAKDINEKVIQKELNNISQLIIFQKNNKDNLLNCIYQVNTYIQISSNEEVLHTSIQFLKRVKFCIDNIRYIISQLETLQSFLTNLCNSADIIPFINHYNELFTSCYTLMCQNDTKIENLIFSYIKHSTLVTSANSPKKEEKVVKELEKQDVTNESLNQNIADELLNQDITNEPLNQDVADELLNQDITNEPLNQDVADELLNQDITNEPLNQNVADEVKEDEKDKEKNNNKNIKVEQSTYSDNSVLLISEKENKVFLPYNINELQNKLEKNKQYTSIQEIIDTEYTIPLDKFKSPIIARFRESYLLMKNKEKASFFDSLDLAFELCFNSLLNPAVISACKNLDELDIYLDCLNTNELDKFKFFDIKYELTPQKI